MSRPAGGPTHANDGPVDSRLMQSLPATFARRRCSPSRAGCWSQRNGAVGLYRDLSARPRAQAAVSAGVDHFDRRCGERAGDYHGDVHLNVQLQKPELLMSGRSGCVSEILVDASKPMIATRFVSMCSNVTDSFSTPVVS